MKFPQSRKTKLVRTRFRNIPIVSSVILREQFFRDGYEFHKPHF